MRLPRDSNDANSEAGTQSFVSPSGVRYFIESYDDTQPPATYHLAPRSTLQSRFDSKCTGTLLKHFFESDGNRGVEFSSASFQAYKQRNEDRVFCHQFDGGLLFGIFDGHGGDILSEHASTSLPPLLAFSLSEALASEPNDAHDLKSTPDMGLHRAAAVEAALVNTFQQFDAALIEQVLALIPNKPLKEWTKDEAVQMMQLHKDIVRKAITGTTALVGYLAGNQRDLWIASLGDSEALARLESEFVALNELHNCKTPEEIERIKSEHPNEDGLVSPQGRILRALAITRAFGDMMFKVDPELGYFTVDDSARFTLNRKVLIPGAKLGNR
ncbi:hypothetical protein VKT23_007276 [Stygiomarasmius scandens]|uniref:PPM-type phosphatase domain-containing protein n=1 Tax=Marasmiellus scandens TaxID=2682957 RepID=A0ABR1JJB5_9AGAR